MYWPESVVPAERPGDGAGEIGAMIKRILEITSVAAVVGALTALFVRARHQQKQPLIKRLLPH